MINNEGNNYYYFHRLLILITIFFITDTYTNAQKNVVIVSATESIQSIKKLDVMKAYQGGEVMLMGNKVNFLDHARDQQVYKDFIKQYFNMTPEDMQEFWKKMKLSGKNAPKFLPDSFLPKALISIKGSISYYYEGEIPAGIHIVNLTE